MILLSISLCFQHLNKKKLVRQLLLMVFFMMFQKTSNFSYRYLYSIRHPLKIWESSFCSPKKTWVLKSQSLVKFGFSHSKLSEIQRNQTSPNRWGRPDLYATFSIGFWNGLLASANGTSTWQSFNSSNVYNVTINIHLEPWVTAIQHFFGLYSTLAIQHQQYYIARVLYPFCAIQHHAIQPFCDGRWYIATCYVASLLYSMHGIQHISYIAPLEYITSAIFHPSYIAPLI